MFSRNVANGTAGAAIALTVVAVAAQLQRPSILSLCTAIVLAAAVSVPLVGAAAVRSTPRNPLGWLLLLSGATLPLLMAADGSRLAGRDTPAWILWLDGWPATPAISTIPLLVLQLYPDGRPLSARWRWLLWLGAAVFVTQLYGELFSATIWDQSTSNPTALPGPAGALATVLSDGIVLLPPIATLSAVVATLRWRRARVDTAGAGPAGLIAAAGWLVAASWWGCVLVVAATGSSDAATIPELAGLLAVGIAGWIGIRRYGTFSTRSVMSRGLVAVLLGGGVLGIYVAVGWAVEHVVAGWLGPAVAVLCAVAAALPLWRALQAAVDRLLFGDRADPVRVLEGLGGRIAAVGDPEQLLPDAIEAVRRALRLPGVELTAGRLRVGSIPSGASVEEFPLVFAGERIGEVRAAHRETGGGFQPRERSALTVLASQLAGAARAVALTEDLRRSRQRIVAEREQERRRITRDLHDGLGARLGGLVLGIQRARATVAVDGDRAAAQLDEATEQVREAMDEVRRLVYELRPPVLDELGLVGALEEQARRHPHVEVLVPTPIGGLPAAVEVAAYRIAVEALTNVARHAPGARATVHIARDHDGVRLRITDSGPGVPDGFRAGVGISSMRERATELHGDLSVSAQPEGGTLVLARIPLGEAG